MKVLNNFIKQSRNNDDETITMNEIKNVISKNIFPNIYIYIYIFLSDFNYCNKFFDL